MPGYLKKVMTAKLHALRIGPMIGKNIDVAGRLILIKVDLKLVDRAWTKYLWLRVGTSVVCL